MAKQAWFSDDGQQYPTELETLEADLKYWEVLLQLQTRRLSRADVLRVTIQGTKVSHDAAKVLADELAKERRSREPSSSMYDQHP